MGLLLEKTNELTSDPMELFKVLANEKTRALCNYGSLYTYGLRCVRKDLMVKFEDMRNNIDFKKTNELDISQFYEFSHGENLSLSIIEKDFEKYFDQEKLRKIVQDNLDETLNPEMQNNRDKEDDLLNFSHLGMSLLEVTDMNIDKNLVPGRTADDTNEGTLDTERILGDVLRIPDDSKINLLDDTNFEIEPKRVKSKRIKRGEGLLFPGNNDSGDEKRSVSRGSQFSSRSTNRRKRRKKSRTGSSYHLNDNKSQKSVNKFGRRKKNKVDFGSQQLKKKPPLLNPKGYSGPKVRSTSNIQDSVLNPSLLSFNQQDYADQDIKTNRMSVAHSAGYGNEGRQRSYTGGRMKGMNGMKVRKRTPEPGMGKSGLLEVNSDMMKNFAKTADFSTINPNDGVKSPYGQKLQFSYRSRSPKPRDSYKSRKSPMRKRRRKKSHTGSNGSLLSSQKPSRDTIPSEYHGLLIKLIDGLGTDFNFSESQMGDKGIHFISYYMSSLKLIEGLRLNNCRVTDKGVALLCEGLQNLKIQKLYLNQNLITVKGITYLLEYVQKKPGIILISLKKNKIEREKITKIIKQFGALKVTLLV